MSSMRTTWDSLMGEGREPGSARSQATPPPAAMHPDDLTALREVTTECAVDVFGSYGVTLVLEEGGVPLGSAPFISFIGFGGPQLRGTLIVVASLKAVRRTYPTPLEDSVEAAPQLFDWAGELANQTLGRITNRLGARGVEVVVSMPRVMFSQHFEVPRSPRSAECQLRFRADGEPVGVWLDAVSSDATRPLIGSVASPSAREGDVLLF